MGIRGVIKQGGGFWNNVDGRLEGVTFTTVPPGADAEASEWIYMVPEIHIDGADKPTTQHLFMGAAERYTLEEDGANEVSGVDDAPVSIGSNTPAGKFLTTLLDANPEKDVEALLPDVEGGEALTFEALAGTRLRLKQEVDEAGTKKQGKRKVKDPKTGKTKEYDRTNTVVVTVYSLPGEEGSGGKKPVGKSPAAKGGKAPAGKPAKAPKGNPLQDKADTAIKELIEAAVDKKNPQGTIPVSKLSVGILRVESLKGDKDKEAVRKLIQTEDYLAGGEDRGIFKHNSDEETVSLVTEE